MDIKKCRKCDYCESKAKYVCDFLADELILIGACEDHLDLALAMQDNVKFIEECKQRSESFNQE